MCQREDSETKNNNDKTIDYKSKTISSKDETVSCGTKHNTDKISNSKGKNVFKVTMQSQNCRDNIILNREGRVFMKVNKGLFIVCSLISISLFGCFTGTKANKDVSSTASKSGIASKVITSDVNEESGTVSEAKNNDTIADSKSKTASKAKIPEVKTAEVKKTADKGSEIKQAKDNKAYVAAGTSKAQEQKKSNSVGTSTDVLGELVKEGTITKAQMTAIDAAMANAKKNSLDKGLSKNTSEAEYLKKIFNSLVTDGTITQVQEDVILKKFKV